MTLVVLRGLGLLGAGFGASLLLHAALLGEKGLVAVGAALVYALAFLRLVRPA